MVWSFRMSILPFYHLTLFFILFFDKYIILALLRLEPDPLLMPVLALNCLGMSHWLFIVSYYCFFNIHLLINAILGRNFFCRYRSAHQL